MSRRGLPAGLSMRHDAHYVEELTQPTTTHVGRLLPIDKLDPNPDQPRTEIGDLTELTASITEKGVLEPLLVKPTSDGRWMIIAGERRWRAATAAGLAEVPCIEMDVDDAEVAEIALIENMQRKDLTPWEEADGLRALSERFGYTHEEVARKVGKSRSTVTEALSIAALPEFDSRNLSRVRNHFQVTAAANRSPAGRRIDAGHGRADRRRRSDPRRRAQSPQGLHRSHGRIRTLRLSL